MIAAVIGGGFYGSYLALFLREGGLDVRLYEREADLLLRASANNQARVHAGYHYPRDLLTAYRSFVNLPRFVAEFRPAIFDAFTALYCIAAQGSKISAPAFAATFEKMGAPIRPAARHFQSLFDPDLIDAVFEVTEPVFDAARLRDMLRDRLSAAEVKLCLDHDIARIEPAPAGRYRLQDRARGALEPVDLVFNCTYGDTNRILRGSDLPAVSVTRELAEIALVEVPASLRGIGITVMDGPFFSVQPLPGRGLHTLSHVRYTPHRAWRDTDGAAAIRDSAEFASNYPYMIRDAARYMPGLADCVQRGTMVEIKAVLDRNEANDGRPILFREEAAMPRVYTVVGAKIDNIYDLVEAVRPIRDGIAL